MTIQGVRKGPSAGGVQGANQTREGSNDIAKGKGESVPSMPESGPVLPPRSVPQLQNFEPISQAVEHMVFAGEGEESFLVKSGKEALAPVPMSLQDQAAGINPIQDVCKDPSAGGVQGANQTQDGSNDTAKGKGESLPSIPDVEEHVVLAGEGEESLLVKSGKEALAPVPTSQQDQAAGIIPMLDVKNIIALVILNMWTEVEERIIKIIDDPAAITVHPVLFMHVRRSRLLRLLDQKKISEAVDYLGTNIVGPFTKVLELGQENLVFASVDYLRKEITWCETCVKAKARLPHVHGETKVMKDVICDYFRLYIRDKISFEVPSTHKLWQFAFKTESPSGKGKPSFRCMVCSVREFSKDSIGKIESHLNQCFLMDTHYLKELFHDCCRSKQIGVASARSQVRRQPQPRTDLHPQTHSKPPVQAQTSIVLDRRIDTPGVSQPPVLTRATFLERFKAEVSTARQIQGQLAVDLPDSMLPRYLANALTNIEMYANIIFYSEQAGTRTVPSTVQRTDITSTGVQDSSNQTEQAGTRTVPSTVQRTDITSTGVQDLSNQTGEKHQENVATTLRSFLAEATPVLVNEQQHPLPDASAGHLHESAGLHNQTEPVLRGGNEGTNTNG